MERSSAAIGEEAAFVKEKPDEYNTDTSFRVAKDVQK
jgi:hypothetical protein